VVQRGKGGTSMAHFASPKAIGLKLSRVFRQSLEGAFFELRLCEILGSSLIRTMRGVFYDGIMTTMERDSPLGFSSKGSLYAGRERRR